MSSKIIVRNTTSELYTEEAIKLLFYLQLSEEELSAPENLKQFEACVSDHIIYMLNRSKSWKIKRFGEDLQWLNTDVPLDFDGELRNKVVVLDFFTYCCINCDHVRPLIHQVEEKYRSNPELVVIGVHSPKHPAEREREGVERALRRNGIAHPVINDANKALWTALGIHCWPTVLVIGPKGKVLFCLVGELAIQKLDVVCSVTLSTLSAAGVALNTRSELPVAATACTPKEEPVLRYPAGISCSKDKVLLSDTGHDRLLLMSLDGYVLDVIGSGTPGLVDGSFESCCFRGPRGSDWLGQEFALVADTGNHCIRLIDFTTRQVSVLQPQGNEEGLLSNNTPPSPYEDDTDEMKSPWDVCIVGGNQAYDTVYIAAAGSHQIWAFYLTASFVTKKCLYSKCFAFAGSGKEECRNNHYRHKAGFAQPSGLCLCPSLDVLCIADSESSSVRSLSRATGSVQTVVGGPTDPVQLFCFGDEDGEGSSAKLQHPLAVCAFTDSKILLADSYNHKLKVVDVAARRSSSVAGCGVRGDVTGRLQEARFDEPSGVCCAGGDRLLVADTNNHALKIVDLEAGQVTPMKVTFPNMCVDGPNIQRLTAKLKAKGEIYLGFTWNQPGFTITDGAPQMWTASFEGAWDWSVCSLSSRVVTASPQPTLLLQLLHAASHACVVRVELSFSVCDDSLRTCLPKKETVAIDVELSESGSESFDALFFFPSFMKIEIP